ncbi:uncharacterized protein A4U43_C03F21760 [Asparagus officinalis]|uniref:Derlin n=1 Tax=Asparagus officinalis TaxID=4686 RepID=A0A5P1FGX5_ASPOF|nr:uncharacterized protein A4U43_C03F21760 [Asparagus officinalis]
MRLIDEDLDFLFHMFFLARYCKLLEENSFRGRTADFLYSPLPIYHGDQTHVVLTSATFVHLKQAEITKYTRKLSPASRAILLSGPVELYQQMLAKALAHHFEAKLLLLDITDFSLKMQSKYGHSNKDSMSAVDAPFIEVLDIFETGGTGGMSKDSVNKLEKSKISKQNNGDDFGEKICYLFAFREPTHVYLHARAAKEGSFKGKDGMTCDESRNRSALGIVVNVFL